ncbi:hypothetical protein HLB23_24405 [Nocardia uniformis]|uniref:Uncharacterized protein n=1 Tax=Nocardia uniformis TaxID=53432 RepID=A0A849C2J7_9NOCA|nr:hypothetical protein [Nocardia uniformis]NNH72963.1 hypothetical protein [Nocardia uniformis]
MVWSAEPGIDLYSSEATLVRATDEADLIALYVGLDHSYPGYAAALADPNRAKRYEAGEVRRTVVGTLLTHVQQIDPTSDGFRAEYCTLINESASTSPGDNRWIGAMNRGDSIAAEFTRTSTTSEAPDTATPYAPAPDRLHWQAPTYNVFDGWTVTFGTGEDPAARARCDAWALSLYPNAPERGDPILLQAPPAPQPAYPGWPAPAV